jgi:cytochrome subunit of sulfide dehydrogenase
MDSRKTSASPPASLARGLIALPIAAGLVLLVAHPSARAGQERDAQLAAACTPCHRLDGRDKGIPSIAGRDEADLTRLLLAYKSGELLNHIMQGVARSLSDEEITEAARYFAAHGSKAKQP